MNRKIVCLELGEIREIRKIARLDHDARTQISEKGFVDQGTLSRMFECSRLSGQWLFQSISVEDARDNDGRPSYSQIWALNVGTVRRLRECALNRANRRSFRPPLFGGEDLAC